MFGTTLDLSALIIVMFGAVVAGFITGLAGFGTALVASGLWFHALPATTVPPLVALSSVVAQIVGLSTVRKSFDWSRHLSCSRRCVNFRRVVELTPERTPLPDVLGSPSP